MRKMAVILLTLHCLAAYGGVLSDGWMRVGGSNQVEVFVDVKSVAREGENFAVSVLSNSNIEVGYGPHTSIVERREIDCRSHRFRSLFESLYNQHNGYGVIVGRSGVRPWEPEPTNGLNLDVFQAVCAAGKRK
jgi:hypothetical protein